MNIMFSAKIWRILFFVGIILINGMLPLRARSMRLGGWHQFTWSSCVVAIGAFLLCCLYQLRLHRNADKEARAAAIQARFEAEPETTTADQPDGPDNTHDAPRAFVPASRKKALSRAKRSKKPGAKKKKRRKK